MKCYIRFLYKYTSVIVNAGDTDLDNGELTKVFGQDPLNKN